MHTHNIETNAIEIRETKEVISARYKDVKVRRHRYPTPAWIKEPEIYIYCVPEKRCIAYSDEHLGNSYQSDVGFELCDEDSAENVRMAIDVLIRHNSARSGQSR